jgi:plastocyanin
MKKAFLGIAAPLVLLAAAGWATGGYGTPAAGPPDDSKPKYEVTIDNFSFQPATLTVPAGTTVTWVNRDDVPNTVASNDNKFRSKALDTDERFSYTFNDAGSYEYFCSLHPKMTAKVVVESRKK